MNKIFNVITGKQVIQIVVLLVFRYHNLNTVTSIWDTIFLLDEIESN